MRRSKANVKYYDERMEKLFAEFPDMKLVENRYKALRALLQKKYQPIMQSVSPDTMIEFLRDADYLSREIRRETEGLEREKKKLLAQEKMVDLGYSPMYREDLKQLSLLK